MPIKSYNVKLVNDNGAKTGCGSATITVRHRTRAEAQALALKHQREIGGPESAWRLHDSEKGKA